MPEYMNRPPRIQPELPQGEVEVPKPPQAEKLGAQALFQIAVPLVTIFGYILVSSTGQGRSLVMIVPMALSVVVTSVLSVYNFLRIRRDEIAKRNAYKQRITELRRELVATHEQQRTFYNHNYPEPEVLLRIASGTDMNRTGSRLWERRTTDKDFGVVRLGMGARKSTVIYRMSVDDEMSPLTRDAERLCKDSHYVTDVPISIPLRPIISAKEDDGDGAARHSVGIAGKDRNLVSDFVRAMIVNLTAFHAPTDMRLFVVGAPSAKPQWDWARWLPHCNTSRNESSAGDQICFEQRKVRRLWDDLQTELERRQIRLADKDSGDVTLPFLLIVVDALMPQAGDSPLGEVEAEAAVSILLQRGPELGAAIIFLVNDVAQVPSECKSVIEIEQTGNRANFRYAEVGLNSTRYTGVADALNAIPAEQEFARKLAPRAVRTTFGADLAMAVSQLELTGKEAVDELPILESWAESRKPENAEWLRVGIGLMPGNKIRELVFAADGDGVHGMIAGTTGSGKSELLLTLIVGMAIKYDPSVVNFVLVDYKGGAAFDPFYTLPHAVDIVTNLQGNAGVRTFTALRAELNRRSKLIADTNVKHIVHYRQKGLHITREPFPFLFVIVDEFAEMVKENPDFKAQLDSITRLGRALGVSLILATQRPAGAVTDQMRANMKFRICLRVETPEDSRELLRRSDAAFLPPNIPGRAYLQVGNENVELMQVARAGGPYTGRQVDASPPVVWLTRQKATEASRPSGPLQEAPALSDVLVEMTHRFSEEYEEVKPQRKPWPNVLPTRLPLDIDYLPGDTERNPLLPINPAVIDWMDGEGSWNGVDWLDQAMRAPIGLIDNPIRAEQLKLTLDFTRGHGVIFGSSGWGKTTFLRTVITSLVATHSPDELHIYALDFGGRGLDVMEGLPHLGASILPSEEERVQRLLRRLTSVLEERKSVLSQARADNLSTYNANNPSNVIPAILVVIDNFAEFRENYENQLDTLISLVRDSRAYGIHFLVTGEQPNSMPGKLYSLFTERMTLKLADSSEYSTIVGRGVSGIDEIAGRGFVAIDRTPLEFQTALPVSVTPEEEAEGMDDAKKLAYVVHAMSRSWKGARPQPIDILRPLIPLRSLLPPMGDGSPRIQTILGLEDLDLQPATFDLQQKGPHFVIVGPPLSGKTTTVRSWILSLAHSYSPQQVAMVLVDFQQRLFKYGGQRTLADLPHVLTTVSEAGQLNDVVTNLTVEYSPSRPEDLPRPKIFFIADNYDDFSIVIGPSGTAKVTAYKDLGDLARKYGPEGLHFVLCGSMNIMRGMDDLMKQVLAPRYGLGLDPSEGPQALGGRVRSGNSTLEFPPGRGYVVKSGRISLVQVALPQDESNTEASLDQWVEEIVNRYPERSVWYRDTLPPEETPPSGSENGTESEANGAVKTVPIASPVESQAAAEPSDAQMSELQAKIAALKGSLAAERKPAPAPATTAETPTPESQDKPE